MPVTRAISSVVTHPSGSAVSLTSASSSMSPNSSIFSETGPSPVFVTSLRSGCCDGGRSSGCRALAAIRHHLVASRLDASLRCDLLELAVFLEDTEGEVDLGAMPGHDLVEVDARPFPVRLGRQDRPGLIELRLRDVLARAGITGVFLRWLGARRRLCCLGDLEPERCHSHLARPTRKSTHAADVSSLTEDLHRRRDRGGRYSQSLGDLGDRPCPRRLGPHHPE